MMLDVTSRDDALTEKQIISRLNQDEFPVATIISLLGHQSLLVKANGFLAIYRKAKGHDELVNDLVASTKNPDAQTRLMGKRLIDLAVVCLLAVATPKSEEAALKILQQWPQDERYEVLAWAQRLDLMEASDLLAYQKKQEALRNKQFNREAIAREA